VGRAPIHDGNGDTTMRNSLSLNHAQTGQGDHWVKRAGLAGFAFFLVKGLLWLLAPTLLYVIGSLIRS
jgi:hypothetical protein